jgi:putative ABC transport system substrate-binding protein
MRRREFITLIGGTAAWPVPATAQQPAVPVIGFLSAVSPDGYSDRVRAFRQGLKEAGYVEGENVAVEYRWAENQLDRLPALAAELVHRPVAVIVATGGTAPAQAAKAATTTIPIVFTVPEDPVKLGLVAGLARPGGNLTGVNFFLGEVLAKRLDLLREVVPTARRIAVLVNPANPQRADVMAKEVQTEAQAMGIDTRILSASTADEINVAFARFERERADALFVQPDPFFSARRVQLANLASRHALPSSFSVRDIVEAGGLMSYGPNTLVALRDAAAYAGRILKGAKPADLPILQSTKFELVINLQTAKMLGLAIPPTLLARADEVIE